jgi:hypothetical protein
MHRLNFAQCCGYPVQLLLLGARATQEMRHSADHFVTAVTGQALEGSFTNTMCK